MEDVNLKNNKKQLIYDAALELFKEYQIEQTSISDIAKKAGVAKGTFYLYFKDKEELIQAVIITESKKIFEQIFQDTQKMDTLSPEDKLIYLVDNLIGQYELKKEYLKIIRKNLYTGLFKYINDPLVTKAVSTFLTDIKSTDIERDKKKLYLIIELVGGVCYNAFEKVSPYSIEDIKEELYCSIRSIIA